MHCFNSRLRILVATCARLCNNLVSGQQTVLYGVAYNTLIRINMLMGILIAHLQSDLGNLFSHEQCPQCHPGSQPETDRPP